jgi:hypothetical protein
MDEPVTVGAGDDENEALAGGSTLILGEDGWEASDYVDPADDWVLLPDGSYQSADGSTRTWLLAGPEPG